MNGIIQYMSFVTGFLYLACFLGYPCCDISFLFVAEWHSVVWIFHFRLPRLSRWALGWFYSLAAVYYYPADAFVRTCASIHSIRSARTRSDHFDCVSMLNEDTPDFILGKCSSRHRETLAWRRLADNTTGQCRSRGLSKESIWLPTFLHDFLSKAGIVITHLWLTGDESAGQQLCLLTV